MTISSPFSIIALSGGVDSAVSAYLLQKLGHRVEAIFMKNWEADDTDTFCPAAKDLEDAEAVCEKLKIDLHVVNFAAQYWDRVFTHFLAEYQKGRTPNPDVICNKEIKFKAFLDYAKLRGAHFIATGHYVRTKQINNQTLLLKGRDPTKDQSYFLYALNANQLAQSIFPVGDLHKKDVRKIAEELGLKNHDKKDSTGICFIGERKFKTFLNEYLPAKPGLIETNEGEVIGEHDGLMFYTLGQRQGLKIGGKSGKSELPWYVASKDLKRNVLIVVQGEHPLLYKKNLIANSLTWINECPKQLIQISAKIRYRQADVACKMTMLDESRAEITFEVPERAITPGQSIVFYQDDICLGGGIIES